MLSADGAATPTVQKVSNKALGNDVFQISSKELQPTNLTKVRTSLARPVRRASRSIRTSVGPTFGRTIANSAVIAIIASLLVISAYVALRFEWKFAVPVLIALCTTC